MAYRDGDRIIFTPAEQQEFAVDESLSPEYAYKLAGDYERMADLYIDRASLLIGEVAFGAPQRKSSLEHRAGRLDTMSKRILGLLGPEIVEAAIKQIDEEH